jgi:beta-lactamase class A
MTSKLHAEQVEQLTRSVQDRFAALDLKQDEFAFTIGTFDGSEYTQYSHRGDERIYPASVVKLFYLVATHRWLEDGSIQDKPELTRAMHDMIVESSNDATHYIIDTLTGTTSGPELPREQMREWARRRNRINGYFQSIGYENLNINQKPWSDGPYGRERIFVGEHYDNRNMLTTNATARLLHDIAQHTCISAARSEQMLTLLKRDPVKTSDEPDDPDDQATKFSARDLPSGTQVWSKAGWTSSTRHDAAYIELPGGERLILVIFTTDHAKDHDIIPYLASELVRQSTQ